MQRLEIEAQQRRVLRRRRLGDVVGHGGHRVLQRGQHPGGHGLVSLVGRGLLAVKGVPGAVERVQRLFQGLGRVLPRARQLALIQFGRVHAPRALDQVVRLVRQHRHLPLVRLRQRVQHGAGIEVVVVVAHRHVAPAYEFLRQEIRTYAVAGGRGAHRGRIEPARPQRVRARGRQPVVEAAGERARFAVARLVGMHAGLLARLQLQHAQPRRGGLRVDRVQRVQRQRPPRPFGGQEEHLVQPRLGTGLEHGKQRAQRLADAGGRLRQQAAAVARASVRRHRQLALAAAQRPVRKRQRRQGGIARPAARLLSLRMLQKPRALFLEERGQRGGLPGFGQHRFFFRARIEIHQRHPQARQAARLAQQMPVHPRLRPVQGALVGPHVFQPPAVGLHLLELVGRGVVAVGPPAHAQAAEFARQRHLGFVAAAPAPGHRRMAGHALQAGRRGREAQVQVAGPRREFAQCPHRHRQARGSIFVLRTLAFALGAARRAHRAAFVLRTPVFALGAARRAHAHAPSSCQVTWQTRAGSPCSAQ